MVSHIHFTVDDSVAERAKAIKANHGLTWPEYVEAANDALGQSNNQSGDTED